MRSVQIIQLTLCGLLVVTLLALIDTSRAQACKYKKASIKVDKPIFEENYDLDANTTYTWEVKGPSTASDPVMRLYKVQNPENAFYWESYDEVARDDDGGA